MATKIKIWIKRIYNFVIYAPKFAKHLKELWEMLKEIYNKETMEELEKITELEKIENEQKKEKSL